MYERERITIFSITRKKDTRRIVDTAKELLHKIEQNDNNNQRKSVIAEELVGLDSIKEDTRYISCVREETAPSN